MSNDSTGTLLGTSTSPMLKGTNPTAIKTPGKPGSGCTPQASGSFTTDNLVVDWSHNYTVISPALLRE